MDTSAPPSFWRSLAIQRRVVFALLMREIITRYGRHNIGFLWLFVEPMMFTLGVTAIWSLVRTTHGSGLSIAAFAMTGYSSILAWRNTVLRCTSAITPNLSLMYHSNVRVADIFAARIVLEIAGASVSFIALALGFTALNWIEPPADVLEVLFGWAMLSWFGTALALTVGAASELSEFVEKIWHPVSYLLFPLSGVAFMVHWLPPYYRELALWVPMVNGLEILREGYFGDAVPTHYDLAYLASVCLGLTFFGLALVRIAGRRVEPQ